MDGEVYKTYEVYCNAPITPEPAPTKVGYTFSGWSDIPETMPANDVVVTGSFTVNNYILTYMVDGMVHKTSSVAYGTTLTPEAEPSKEGYTFSGWSEIPETMPAHDVTVTGSFTINNYTLIYMLDGEVYKTSNVVYGTTITPEPELGMEGYTFSGWSWIPKTMPANDVVVTGSFTANKYMLTYIIDGKRYKSYEIGYNSVLIPESVPVKKGMTFSGWGDFPKNMPAHDVILTGLYSWSQRTLDNAIYQVTDTLNNYVSVNGNDKVIGKVKILSSVEIDGYDYTVNSIGSNAFINCKELASITIPESVTYIGTNAFYNCSNLYTVILESNSIVSKAYSSDFSLRDIFGEQVQEYMIGDKVASIGSYAFSYCRGLLSVIIPQSVISIGQQAFYRCGNLTSVTFDNNNLTEIGSNALPSYAKLHVNRGTKLLLTLWKNGYTNTYERGTEKALPPSSLSFVDATQMTAIIKIKDFYNDLTYTLNDEIIRKDTKTLYAEYPEYRYNLTLKISLGDVTYTANSISFQTKGLNMTAQRSESTASSLTLKAGYEQGDAPSVTAQTLTIGGVTVEGDEIYLNGLRPNTFYTVKYTITVDGKYNYSGNFSVWTDALKLTTQQPRVIKEGDVVVASESNLDDEETNVGFEWRRTDWTNEFQSNKAGAYLYEGMMEGYIRNMNTNYLWKYRPYYEANDGSRYYGEWLGIDPTNTSYFEPTVHTYDKIEVNGNRARVKGYAMRGSDNIVSQGFRYWRSTESATRAKQIEADGQVMAIELKDLEYHTTYRVVAFVTTSEGKTYYGKEQIFTTGDPTGIEETFADEPQKITEEGIYDLSGRKLERMQKGINIIRKADGTTKKVLVK